MRHICATMSGRSVSYGVVLSREDERACFPRLIPFLLFLPLSAKLRHHFPNIVTTLLTRHPSQNGQNVEGLSSGSGHGGGDGGGSEGVGEAGRLGDNDNDVDEHDAPAIVSRANYLLDTGCQVRFCVSACFFECLCSGAVWNSRFEGSRQALFSPYREN